MGEDKIVSLSIDKAVPILDIIETCTQFNLYQGVTDTSIKCTLNALHDIVERAIELEDKTLLQACGKLGLLEDGQWRNLKS
jgi:hypothetical protein